MGDAIQKMVETFEGLIRRSIAPSITFFVLFAVGELVAVELAGGSAVEQWRSWLAAVDWGMVKEASGLVGFLAFLVILGLGYGLSSVQQVLFDNLLKKNFAPGPLVCCLSESARSEKAALEELREKALGRMDEEDDLRRLAGAGHRTDFVLYEIIGGIDPVSTRSFVDGAKSIGVVASSAMAVVLWNLLSRWPFGQEASLKGAGKAALLLALVLAIWWVGREATLAQYRQRSLRHYVNFLMMPKARLAGRLYRPDEESFPDEPEKVGMG